MKIRPARKKGPVSQQLVVRAVQSGIERAAREYPQMSGLLARDAPEAFFVSSIASRLRAETKGKCYVVLEKIVRDILVKAGAREKGRYKIKMRKAGRADILLQFKDKERRPWALIEVKHPLAIVDKKRIDPDVERICSTLLHARESSSLRFGIFAFYYGKKINQVESLKVMESKVKNKIEKYILKLAKVNGCCAKLDMKTNGDGERKPGSAAVCFVIKRRRDTSG